RFARSPILEASEARGPRPARGDFWCNVGARCRSRYRRRSWRLARVVRLQNDPTTRRSSRASARYAIVPQRAAAKGPHPLRWGLDRADGCAVLLWERVVLARCLA